MNADITPNGITFTMSAPGTTASGSVRKNVSYGGAQRPVYLTIKHQDYVDNATKVAGRRSLVRLDMTHVDADGKKAVTSVYLVVAQPTSFVDVSTPVNTAVEELVTTMGHIVCGATLTGALDLKNEIFILEQQ
jgi:hypothetical protein